MRCTYFRGRIYVRGPGDLGRVPLILGKRERKSQNEETPAGRANQNAPLSPSLLAQGLDGESGRVVFLLYLSTKKLDLPQQQNHVHWNTFVP